jgi:hypothetical protein
MRRELRTRWLHAVLGGLAGTGTLGLAGPATAQSAASRYNVAQAVASPVDPGTARRGELECALLADPLTFPYPLQAVFHDNTLEIHGTVPSLAVRERVLTLARAVHNGAISDRMDVELSSARRLRPAPASALQHALMQRLRAACPQHVPNVAVQCDERGNAVVSGSVLTWTEKRTIHQTLRDTPGLVSLANRVQLSADRMPAPADGIVQASAVADSGGVVHAGGTPSVAPPNALADPLHAVDGLMRVEASIMHLCPLARNLHVVLTGPMRCRIELDAPDELTRDVCVQRIFRMEELRRYHIDVVVSTPKR